MLCFTQLKTESLNLKCHRRMLHCSFGIGKYNNHYIIIAAHDGSDENACLCYQYAHTHDYIQLIYDTNMQCLSLHRQLRNHQLSLQCCMF